ncbi:hypothetical protein RUND412_003552 [Rhizina undulata]
MPPLPPLATPVLLRSLHANPALPKNTWYFLASVTLSILNRPDDVGRTWSYALENCARRDSASAEFVRWELERGLKFKRDYEEEETALRISFRMREALLKSAVVGGLPKAINSLNVLKALSPEHITFAPSPTGRAAELESSKEATHSELKSRGMDFFNQVYGKVARRVMGSMNSSYEDLAVVARAMYGSVLGNLVVLDGMETSLVMVAGLVPLEVNPQLKGHLKGAINNGATKEEVMAVREVVMDLCGRAGMEFREEVAKL